MIKKFLKTEYSHFKALNEKAQKLLISFFFFELAWPLLSLFANAFIWRQLNDELAIVIYNVGFFVALPIGFKLNGLLLKYFKVTQLYFFGLLSQVLVVGGIIFATSLSFEFLYVFGFLYGLFASLYWGNRNYMRIQITTDSERNYFKSISTNTGIITGLVIPFIAGWLIEYGELSGFYSPDLAYKVFFLIVLVLILFTYKVISSVEFEKPVQIKIKNLPLSPLWNKMRIVSFLLGCASGLVFYIPNLVVLRFLGGEGILGTIQSISAVLIFIVMYFFGKFAKKEHRTIVLIVGIAILTFGMIILSINFDTIGVFVFMGASIIGGTLSRNIYGLVYMKTVDEEGTKGKIDYALVSDTEFYINVGRILAAILFVAAIKTIAIENAFRAIFVWIIVSQVVMIYFIWKMSDKNKNTIKT